MPHPAPPTPGKEGVFVLGCPQVGLPGRVKGISGLGPLRARRGLSDRISSLAPAGVGGGAPSSDRGGYPETRGRVPEDCGPDGPQDFSCLRVQSFTRWSSNPEPQFCACKPRVDCLRSPTALSKRHSHVPRVMGLGALGSSAPVLGSGSSREEPASADSAEWAGGGPREQVPSRAWSKARRGSGGVSTLDRYQDPWEEVC